VINRKQLWWCKDHCEGCHLNAKRASMRKYVRGQVDQCLSAAYINFLTLLRAAYNKRRLTIE